MTVSFCCTGGSLGAVVERVARGDCCKGWLKWSSLVSTCCEEVVARSVIVESCSRRISVTSPAVTKQKRARRLVELGEACIRDCTHSTICERLTTVAGKVAIMLPEARPSKGSYTGAAPAPRHMLLNTWVKVDLFCAIHTIAPSITSLLRRMT